MKGIRAFSARSVRSVKAERGKRPRRLAIGVQDGARVVLRVLNQPNIRRAIFHSSRSNSDAIKTCLLRRFLREKHYEFGAWRASLRQGRARCLNHRKVRAFFPHSRWHRLCRDGSRGQALRGRARRSVCCVTGPKRWCQCGRSRSQYLIDHESMADRCCDGEFVYARDRGQCIDVARSCNLKPTQCASRGQYGYLSRWRQAARMCAKLKGP